MPLALTDSQLGRLMAAATALDDPGKRHTLLVRVAAHLQRDGTLRPSDDAFDHVLATAQRGLMQRQSGDAAETGRGMGGLDRWCAGR